MVDRWMNLMHDKIDLVQQKNSLLQTFHESRHYLSALLDNIYDVHHSTVYLNNVNLHNSSIKEFEFGDNESSIYEFRSLLCSLHCEVLLTNALYSSDVGEQCNDVVSKIKELYIMLDKIRDCYTSITQIEYVQEKVPL